MNPRPHEDIIEKKVIYNWILVNSIIFVNPIPAKLFFWDYSDILNVLSVAVLN
ncbi:hypothetical protein [Bacteroides thetaiotaomicron]|uniref:hypothetical protein n=1 Tax=Bacteroides thetaiotaomicron TaxID=818 RepID=UPI001FB90DA1|nr:hypothetical protein [Bacteroides thetaiotaomicron]